MHTAHLPLAVIVALTGVTLPPHFAQDAAHAPPTSAVALWSGAVRAELDDELASSLALDDAELDPALAAIGVQWKTDRDYAAALEALDALRLRLARTGRPYPELWTRTAEGRASLLLELGRPDEATRATLALLPSREELRRALDPAELHPLPTAWVDLLDRARSDPRLVALRERAAAPSDALAEDADWLRERLDGASFRYLLTNFGAPGSQVTRLVWKALANEEWDTLVELGLRATPTLVLYLLERPEDQDSAFDVDPLAPLIRYDSKSALKLIEDRLEGSGPNWRRRVARAMEREVRFADRSRWRPAAAEHGGSRFEEPRWLALVAELLTDPLTRDTALAMLPDIATHDGLTPRLQALLSAELAHADATGAFELLSRLAAGARRESVRPVFQAGLASALPEVRRACAERLVEYDADDVLLGLADDADAAVRVAVARSLASREVLLTKRSGSGSATFQEAVRVTPELTPQAVAAWVSLLDDPEPEVQDAALDALHSRRDVPADVFRAGLASPREATRERTIEGLASRDRRFALDERSQRAIVDAALRDPAPAVRAVLAHVPLRPLEDQRHLLTALAADESPEVLRELDRYVLRYWNLDAWHSEAMCAALERRMANGAHAFDPGAGGASGWRELCYGEMEPTELETLASLRVGLRHGVDAAVSAALEGLRRLAMKTPDGDVIVGRILDLDAELLARLYTWSVGADRTDQEVVLDALTLSSPVKAVAMRRVVLDRGAPNRARIGAAAYVDPTGDAELEEAYLELLGAPEWTDGTVGRGMLSNLGTGPERANALFLRALEAPGVDDRVLAAYASRVFHADAPLADRAARAILERWLAAPGTARHGCVEEALLSLGRPDPPPGTVETLIAASRDPRYMQTAVRAMDRHGAPEYVESLAACLTSRALLGASDADHIQIRAANALVRYGTPEAAAHLRDGLLMAVGDDVRTAILMGLDTLRRIEQEKLSWQARPLGSRTDALAELVALLASPDELVRAEAVRGIGTFGAVEAIPRLIPLLQDDAERVRDAARAALDRLHAVGDRGEAEGEEPAPVEDDGAPGAS